jgi:alpha-ribazole phosphatase
LAKLLLVRHGETELNSALRYWGRMDIGLGAMGIRQAEQLRDRLATERIDCVYSSIMRRAVVTAQTIASIHRLNVIRCPELREIDFGKLEGLNFNEVSIQYPEVAQMWISHDTELVYPEGESLSQLDQRIAEFKIRLTQHADSDTVLVVAHSGVLRTLICQILNLEMKNRWNIRIDLASLSILEIYPNTAILSLLNDTSHLMDRWV